MITIRDTDTDRRIDALWARTLREGPHRPAVHWPALHRPNIHRRGTTVASPS